MVTGSHISENVRTRIGIAHICWNLAYSVAMTSLEAAVNEWVDYLRVEKGASAHTVSNYRRDALRYAHDLGERGVVSLADVNARDIDEARVRGGDRKSRSGLVGRPCLGSDPRPA